MTVKEARNLVSAAISNNMTKLGIRRLGTPSNGDPLKMVKDGIVYDIIVKENVQDSRMREATTLLRKVHAILYEDYNTFNTELNMVSQITANLSDKRWENEA